MTLPVLPHLSRMYTSPLAATATADGADSVAAVAAALSPVLLAAPVPAKVEERPVDSTTFLTCRQTTS